MIPPRSLKLLRHLSIGCFGVVAFLSMFGIPFFPVVPQIDFSWAGALPYFFKRGFSFGTDVVFTYGPLGFLTGFAYTDYFPIARVVSEILLKLIGAALCCWAICEMRSIIGFLFGASVILLLGTSEETYSLLILLPACLMLRRSFLKPLLFAFFGLLFAVLALIKFTYLLQSICAVATVAGYCTVRRRWTALTFLTGSFGLGIVLCWILSGQEIRHFGAYIAHSLAITEGYNRAMFTPTSNNLALSMGLAAGILLVVQLSLLFRNTEEPARVLFGSVFLLLMSFLLWKHAFTRWENHAPLFFHFFPEVLFAAWLLNDNKRYSVRLPLAVSFLALICTVIGAAAIQPQIVSEALSRPRTQVLYAYRVLTRYKEFDSARRQELGVAKGEFYLPKIRSIIGNNTVDVFGCGQGIALLNELNYVPRPVFQGYSAYTSSLIALNTEHYQSDQRPEFVISKLETIDDRFPTLDDSKVLLELLYHYQPLATENGWQVWKAAASKEEIKPRPISTVMAKLDQWIPVPEDGPIWLELELTQTRWASLRSFLYKNAPAMIELSDDSGLTSRYRIIPSMIASGCLLNPRVTDDSQLRLAAGGSVLPRYKSLRITTAGQANLFKNRVKISFSTLPPLGAR